jgi:hypothetical protein
MINDYKGWLFTLIISCQTRPAVIKFHRIPGGFKILQNTRINFMMLVLLTTYR